MEGATSGSCSFSHTQISNSVLVTFFTFSIQTTHHDSSPDDLRCKQSLLPTCRRPYLDYSLTQQVFWTFSSSRIALEFLCAYPSHLDLTTKTSHQQLVTSRRQRIYAWRRDQSDDTKVYRKTLNSHQLLFVYVRNEQESIMN